jgi:single-strand DNA-binding protein
MNRVTLVGRLTKDVEVKKTQSDLSVASFTVAVDRRKSKDQEDTADFISCVAWRQQAEFLGNYARKGNRIGVDGRIQTRSYDDKDGKKVYVTEVVCDNVELLTSKSENKDDFQIAAEQYEAREEKAAKSARRNGEPKLNGEPINTEDAFGYDDTLPSIDPERDLPFY